MISEEIRQQKLVVTKGNEEALEWLLMWDMYVHGIDAFCDWDSPADVATARKEFLLMLFAHACVLYSHPFYLKHLPALRMIVLNCTNAYADVVVSCEGSGVKWREEFADVYRHFGVEMALAVAAICGGYEHMRAVSGELRWRNYNEHHDAEGNPT